ncbi:A/G-specific adenine glycosylase [Spirochaetota bacterium]
MNKITGFKKHIYDFYKINKRDLPWRKNKDPYNVYISEIMLQQTQVPRVIEKYTEFIKIFPCFKSITKAPFSKVLSAWQGLGYNRRALFLKKASNIIVQDHRGELPSDFDTLISLPGIGDATAHSIRVYAFNMPDFFIETNIRSVYIDHFFKGKENIKDSEILPIAEKALDLKNPSKWYNALMDYGTFLKSTVQNPNIRSRHYSKQSKFEGSDRQIRGSILRKLIKNKAAKEELHTMFIGKRRTNRILKQLVKEGFILKDNNEIYTVSN